MSNRALGMTLALAVAAACLNFSQESSDGHDHEPRINCVGTLVDSQGNEVKVKHITINGLFERIPVYAKPASTTSNPSDDRQEINLCDVHQIIFPHWEHPMKGIHKFRDREYVDVSVVDKKGKKRDFVVERYRELVLKEKEGGLRGKRYVRFEALRSLTIEQCTARAMCELYDNDASASEESAECPHLQASTSPHQGDHELIRANPARSILKSVRHTVVSVFDHVSAGVKNLFA